MRGSGADGKKPIKEVEKLCAQKPKLERVSHYITKDRKARAVLTGTEVGVEQARRKTGIDILGDVAWGMHFCVFYQSKQDLIDILVPYFKAGLENNEFCMWICWDPLRAEEARAALSKKLSDIDGFIKKGQIEIVDYTKRHTVKGDSGFANMKQFWIEKEKLAFERGFEGLRLAGNTYWLERNEWKDFVKYEEEVDEIIRNHKMLAICPYSLDKCGGPEIIDVVGNHKSALIRREGKWESIESSGRAMMYKTLQESEKKYRDLIEKEKDIIYTLDYKGNITSSNPAVEAILGYKPEKLIGKNFMSLIPKDWQEKTTTDFNSLLKTGEIIAETVLLDKKGQPHFVEYSSTVIKERDEVVGTRGIARDITERKKAEAEARDAQQKLIEQQRHEKERVEEELAKVRDELVRRTRLAAIGQVSASIAHDLRNPLGAVRNASYFLRRRLSKDEPKASEHLKIIDQEVAKADQIITNLLEMARPKASHKQVVDLAEIIEQVFGQAKRIEGVRCRTALVPDPFMIKTDPNQLRQAIGNIVNNAVDAMEGHGEFPVEATRDSDYDTLVFRDTGPGFDPEVRDRLFEPLVTTKASGNGLGLTICRQIVEKHGGTIHAEDYKGGGAVIRIRLPRQ